MNIVLGISISHNGGVALICDGDVKVAIQAERISRVKRRSLRLHKDDSELAQKCIRYCLNAENIKYEDINAIAITTPWKLKQENNTNLFNYIGGIPKNYLGTFYVPHHFTHMEYIVHYGDLKPGIVLVIDGSGSFEKDRYLFNINERMHNKILNNTQKSGKEVISAYWFDGSNSSLIYRFSPSHYQLNESNKYSNGFLQSIGHYWEWASSYCCSSRNGAGKLMGLAAFGECSNSNEPNLLSINDNAEIKLDFCKIKEIYKKPNLFSSDLSNSKHHQNLANRVQKETENVILKLLEILKKKFPCDNLYFSGGVALNVVANERIKNSNLFKEVILNGSVEDNGTAIGAGLAVDMALGGIRKTSAITDYYGKEYFESDFLNAISKYDFQYKILSEEEIFKLAAELIEKENVIGWFQGRSEFGPRALGNRSIFANPSSPRTKYILDHYMKCRDRYRPYAPVVIEERANEYFEINDSSPVMMRNVKVLNKSLVAVTHVDGTARVQTVNEKDNKPLYSLLLEVDKKIGMPILLNTSFNQPGEPIVESPNDALSSFSNGNLDYLFLGNILIYH